MPMAGRDFGSIAFTPHGVVHTEALLRAFDGYGLDAVTVLHAAVTVAGFVRGCATGLEDAPSRTPG